MGVIVGIDEVGRGCWAGPLVAAAVCLKQPIPGLTDSKLLSRKKRAELSKEITLSSNYGLGWVWPAEVDQLGLTKATEVAMQSAIQSLSMYDYGEVIIDGNYLYNIISFCKNRPCRALVKADSLVPAVSAASIIAKVARDQYMAQQALKYPGYGFEAHVGYGTARHLAALRSLGITDIHRRSYKPIKALASV
ncbi:MAG: ribonuclease HII [Patescibacteria group bacterium]